MLPNQDFRDLFVELNAHGVEYLVVGAHALAALTAFGAPMHTVAQNDFAVPGITSI